MILDMISDIIHFYGHLCKISDSPATSCLSLNGTLGSLNDSFVALGVQPPWLFNTIRDGAAMLSLTLVADSLSTVVVSATVDLLFLSVNQVRCVQLKREIYLDVFYGRLKC